MDVSFDNAKCDKHGDLPPAGNDREQTLPHMCEPVDTLDIQKQRYHLSIILLFDARKKSHIFTAPCLSQI